MDKYKVVYFTDIKTGHCPVREYINQTSIKDQAKIFKYIEFLRQCNGVLDEPYSKHIRGKIRELRVDFTNHRHRIFYFTFVGRSIILLHAFRKSTDKTPTREIIKAENNLQQVIRNHHLYVD